MSAREGQGGLHGGGSPVFNLRKCWSSLEIEGGFTKHFLRAGPVPSSVLGTRHTGALSLWAAPQGQMPQYGP